LVSVIKCFGPAGKQATLSKQIPRKTNPPFSRITPTLTFYLEPLFWENELNPPKRSPHRPPSIFTLIVFSFHCPQFSSPSPSLSPLPLLTFYPLLFPSSFHLARDNHPPPTKMPTASPVGGFQYCDLGTPNPSVSLLLALPFTVLPRLPILPPFITVCDYLYSAPPHRSIRTPISEVLSTPPRHTRILGYLPAPPTWPPPQHFTLLPLPRSLPLPIHPFDSIPLILYLHMPFTGVDTA